MPTKIDEEKTEIPSHTPGTRRGEEVAREEGTDPGRDQKGHSHTERPTGERTSRDSTGINPQDPVDPKSPKIPPA